MARALTLAIACAALSIPVVLRRWAFIGEGIGHSAFGGAGMAWIAALLIPSLDQDWAPYLFVSPVASITIFDHSGHHPQRVTPLRPVEADARSMPAAPVFRTAGSPLVPGPEVALLGRTDQRRQCLFIWVKGSCWSHAQMMRLTQMRHSLVPACRAIARRVGRDPSPALDHYSSELPTVRSLSRH